MALGTVALLLSGSLAADADGPDRETADYIIKRYSLPLASDRGGCTHYANPKAIYQQGTSRSLPVLLIRGELGGTMCNGVFRFQTLLVDCKTSMVAYTERIGSPANWEKPSFYENVKLARKVCSLPAQSNP